MCSVDYITWLPCITKDFCPYYPASCEICASFMFPVFQCLACALLILIQCLSSLVFDPSDFSVPLSWQIPPQISREAFKLFWHQEKSRQTVWHPAGSRIQWSSHKSPDSWMAQECGDCLWAMQRSFLCSWALVVYRQLDKEQRSDVELVKHTLVITFVMDLFVVFKNFMTWQLLTLETVDMFLAEL